MSLAGNSIYVIYKRGGKKRGPIGKGTFAGRHKRNLAYIQSPTRQSPPPYIATAVNLLGRVMAEAVVSYRLLIHVSLGAVVVVVSVAAVVGVVFAVGVPHRVVLVIEVVLVVVHRLERF